MIFFGKYIKIINIKIFMNKTFKFKIYIIKSFQTKYKKILSAISLLLINSLYREKIIEANSLSSVSKDFKIILR